MKVEAKVTGQRRRSAEPREIDVPAGPLALRELIERVVNAEVAAFRLRQLDGRLLQVLSPEQIASGAEAGKISSGGSDLDQEVDDAAAVATALEAFEDGLYFVFFNGVQVESLEDRVEVGPDSGMLFVRLVPLIGG